MLVGKIIYSVHDVLGMMQFSNWARAVDSFIIIVRSQLLSAETTENLRDFLIALSGYTHSHESTLLSVLLKRAETIAISVLFSRALMN